MKNTSNLVGLVILVIFTFLVAQISVAQISTDRSTTLVIESKTLSETREIFIRVPPNYEPENKKYPVVYVLDGGWNFEYVASYLDYMFTHNIYPEMIVTGIRNVNRNRDYVPKADPYHNDTGGADDFLKFVKNEWIEKIDKTYSTSEYRFIIGHSFGGVFVMHAFFSNTVKFDGFIALSTSAWIADNILLEEAQNYFENTKEADAFVYMAVGEGDGGPTLPSSQSLTEVFKKSAPKSLEWVFDITPQTDHFKNFSSGMHDAFMALFPAWGFDKELTEIGRNEGVIGVNAWFTKKQNTLGIRFQPAWFDLGMVAFTLTQEAHGNAAIAVINNLQSFYPRNGHVANFAALVYEMNGKYKESKHEYKLALEIITEQNLHPNTIHKGSIESGLKRVNELLSKSEKND